MEWKLHHSEFQFSEYMTAIKGILLIVRKISPFLMNVNILKSIH